MDFVVVNLLTFINFILLMFWLFNASTTVLFSNSPSRFFISIVYVFWYLGVYEWNFVFFSFSILIIVA